MGPKLKAWFDFQPSCIPYCKNAQFMEIDKDWYYWLQFPGKAPMQIWIARKYFYDGASIPRFFWRKMGSPFHPVYWAGSLGHDHGYLTHVFARNIMDEIIYQLVKQSSKTLPNSDLSEWELKEIWFAVRNFGYFAYKNSNADLQALSTYKTMCHLREDGEKFLQYLPS